MDSEETETVKISLSNVSIELEKELVDGLARYGITPEQAIAEALERPLWKILRREEELRCPKCGKPTPQSDGYHLAKINILKAGSVEKAGYCTC